MQSKFIVIGILVVTSLGFIWFANRSGSKKISNQVNNIAKLVSPQEFAELAKSKDAFILDVHTPEQTHIPGTNAFIPYDQIGKNTDKLPKDKTAPVLVYCRSGSMSASAAKELASLGYTQVYDLAGGTDAYKKSQESVSLTPKTKAFGTVVYGDVVTTNFTLTNYSPLPVKITWVSTSCGCTKASVEKKELGAYESTAVNVSFDPAVHKDDTDVGDLTRTIFIRTDNPNYPELESTITATVVRKE